MFLFLIFSVSAPWYLKLFYIYPIVPYTPAFLHSFLLLVTVAKYKDPKRHTYFYTVVLECSCVLRIYPIVPYAPASLRRFLITSDCYKG